MQNENKNDRIIRAIAGAVLLALGFMVLGGTSQLIAYVAGGALIFTAITGFCLLYKLFGINTNK